MNEEGKTRYLIQSLTLDWDAVGDKVKFLLQTLKGRIKNSKKGLSVELTSEIIFSCVSKLVSFNKKYSGLILVIYNA